MTIENKTDNRMRLISLAITALYAVITFVYVVFLNKSLPVRLFITAMMLFSVGMGLYGCFAKSNPAFQNAFTVNGKLPLMPPSAAAHFADYFIRRYKYKKDKMKIKSSALCAAILELEVLGFLKIGYSTERGILLNVSDGRTLAAEQEPEPEQPVIKRKTKSASASSGSKYIDSRLSKTRSTTKATGLPAHLEPVYELLKEIDSMRSGPMCLKEFEFYVMYHSIRTETKIKQFTEQTKKPFISSLDFQFTRNFGKSKTKSSGCFTAFFAIAFVGFFIGNIIIVASTDNPINIPLSFIFFLPLIVSNGITENLSPNGVNSAVSIILLREYLANYNEYYGKYPLDESKIATYLAYAYALGVFTSFSDHVKTLHSGLNITLFYEKANESIIDSAQVFI